MGYVYFTLGFGLGFVVKSIHSLVCNYRLLKQINKISEIMDCNNSDSLEKLKEKMCNETMR